MASMIGFILHIFPQKGSILWTALKGLLFRELVRCNRVLPLLNFSVVKGALVIPLGTYMYGVFPPCQTIHIASHDLCKCAWYCHDFSQPKIALPNDVALLKYWVKAGKHHRLVGKWPFYSLPKVPQWPAVSLWQGGWGGVWESVDGRFILVWRKIERLENIHDTCPRDQNVADLHVFITKGKLGIILWLFFSDTCKKVVFSRHH